LKTVVKILNIHECIFIDSPYFFVLVFVYFAYSILHQISFQTQRMDGFLSLGFLALSARTGAINAQAPPLRGFDKPSGPQGSHHGVGGDVLRGGADRL